MENLIDKIKKVILKQTPFCEFEDKQYGLALVEKQNEGLLYKLDKVEIIGLDENQTVAFKLDDSKLGKVTSYLKASVPKIHRQCDYIIVSKIGEEVFVLITEMKSGDEEGLKSKLINSWAFFSYIVSVIYGANTDVSILKINFGFVLFQRRKGKAMIRELGKSHPFAYDLRRKMPGTNLKVLRISTNRPMFRISINDITEHIDKSEGVIFTNI